jgi:hypothetical protein
MGKIETIKQKILQLDSGAFQNLCNSYLSKKGYPNITSLGSEAGTQKTTKGTPDAYFVLANGHYVFAEYTTQQTSIFQKIKTDLKKCLDVKKTGISHDKISEIIYCHTSSNIKPCQDLELKASCEKVGIKLTIIGIDTLAEDIYLYHHDISRDFLGISISSGQIQSFNNFIKNYNSNKMAAPIDTEFLFREKELKDIEEAFQTTDVVILNGKAGTGKTRLALHYVEKIQKTNNKKVYCIHSNALSIYEDLKIFIDRPGDYFLFIDDANQLSELQHIIRYTTMKPKKYNVRILITVRDYALQQVKNDVSEIASCESITVNSFTDNEIKELLKVTLGITNHIYHEKIIRIAEGNARIAMLAGKLAINSNNLDSINDVSQLYNDYYRSFLENNPLLTDKKLCITAGIVAFLEAIHLDHIDAFLPVLQKKELNKDNFLENLRTLHALEIVDITNDKAVRFSDQCFSNYFLKYVFCDKKLISLSEMIKTCFQKHSKRTTSSIKTLLNIFGNDALIAFIEKEIKILWNELSAENSPHFFEFVKVFFSFNPTETLLILQNKIELEKKVTYDLSDIDINKGKNNQNVTNDIINILGGFADMTDFPTALDLFFQYYLKRPDLYMDFYHAINIYFSINKNSAYNNYYTQINLFEKIKEHSNNWNCECFVILFLEIAKEFLKMCFSPVEGGRKNTFNIYEISLTMSAGVKNYRRLIWEYLSYLCKFEKYKSKIREILNCYCISVVNNNIPVLQFDFEYINSILVLHFPPSKLANCLLANRIVQVFDCINLPCKSIITEYLENDDLKLYFLLKGQDNKKDASYEEYKEQKQHIIKQHISDCDLEMFKRLIDVCSDISEIDNDDIWEFKDGLDIAFNSIISLGKDYYVDAIKYYIKKDTPNNILPNQLISTLFSLLPASEVYQIVINEEFSQKNAWLYAYYHELPSELITENHLFGVYEFLKDKSDKDITSSPSRDVDFLEKYSVIDRQAFIKGCKIILEKINYSPFMVSIYFALLFNHCHNSPKEVIRKFNCDFELLEEIYYTMLSICNKSLDYEGLFLKEIYLVNPSILDKYISCLTIKYNTSFHDSTKRHCCFFDLDNFIEIYNRIFEQLIKNCTHPQISIPYFLETLLSNEQKYLAKQNDWIRQCIVLFSSDETKMYYLFSVISNFEIERKREFILLFLENNSLFESFNKIPLTPISCSWIGSAVPVYSGWVEFLESLLPYLTGLKWIKHKKHVEEKIDSINNQIESEQIDEILRG